VARHPVGGRRVDLVVRVVRHPLRVDVELHRAYCSGAHEYVAERLGVEAVAPDEDETAVRVHPDRRPPHEHLVAERGTPLVVRVRVQARHRLAAVHHEVEVLADRLDPGIHREVASPHADVHGAVLEDHE